ncbi:MAG: dihydrodipicolinate synthase family protein [Rhodospirillales bacterium]|jgi:4-hydroxy-tetrahydrodipicolinate synthase|nr:dihydrodipicolinate synthase family protein [Rhodospirillaceae bacterium]MDP6426750.1 dihydrodipicolinate synthase family protein [Rhodospirillales bacterium]MDP6643320.1 dihydrodipicolinate synthase family protein [Rhodospirillales bacterium]
MARFNDFQPAGVIPATLLVFNEDLSIDEAATASHLKDVAAVDGISAITVNGHASEVHACNFDEQRRILDLTLDEIGGQLPVINGVYQDGSLEAARIARMAEQAGASCLLIFPPHSIGYGNGVSRPEMILSHFKTIADATDLPFIAFQYPVAKNYAYPIETLVRMAEEIPSFRAIKDSCNDPVRHELHIRTLQNLSRPVNVLSTHSAWLMASLSLGCAGLLSGSGSVIADLQVALFNAVQDGDLTLAQAINDRIQPTAKCFYADPTCDMHNRMKEALVMLGRLPRATVRPPLFKLSDTEIAGIKEAIKAAGLTRQGAVPEAAE